MADQPTPTKDKSVETTASGRAKAAPPPLPAQGAAKPAKGADATPTKAPSQAAATTNENEPASSPSKSATAERSVKVSASERPAKAATAAPGRTPAGRPGPLALETDDEPLGFGASARMMLRQTPSWLTSMVVHIVVLLLLGLVRVEFPEEDKFDELVVDRIDLGEELEELEAQEQLEKLEFEDAPLAEAVATDTVTSEPTEIEEEPVPTVATDVALSEIGEQFALREDLMRSAGSSAVGDLGQRGSAEARMAALAGGGGSSGSETAVTAGLEWLAKHQYGDGSWSFDHRGGGTCQGKCDHHGTLREARFGATGLALLPFLGAGQTHKEGKYKETVRKGLLFLGQNMKGGSLFESGGSMYSHGICAIAICEAYAMTQDKNLYQAAQAAVNFTVNAQDPVGGGWRYTPRQAGDTSAVGWQIMALKSGHMGYLAVPQQTILGATNFLNSVQTDGGAAYGYDQPGAGQATTAVGLLSRMYLGWKKDNPALQKGVELLSTWGPSMSKGTANMYYNYYATQVMHHWEGDLWKKWNEGPDGNNGMRDFLVGEQSQKGHEKGSWYLTGDIASDIGGRHYSTTMSVMTLEVYYRHMPLYRQQSTEDDFEFEE